MKIENIFKSKRSLSYKFMFVLEKPLKTLFGGLEENG